MFDPDLLKNKTVIITGGGTGLGKSMAQRFGELGANLVITSRKLEVLEETAEEIRTSEPAFCRFNVMYVNQLKWRRWSVRPSKNSAQLMYW
jgi:short-subunit dehydrogenase involved in D-alanine esterification of teichoic acids